MSHQYLVAMLISIALNVTGLSLLGVKCMDIGFLRSIVGLGLVWFAAAVFFAAAWGSHS